MLVSQMTRRDFGTVAISAAAAGVSSVGVASTDASAQTAGVPDAPMLMVPPQQIPVPTSISPAAQAYLAAAHKRIDLLQVGDGPAPRPAAAPAGPPPIPDAFRQAAAKFKGKAETIDLGNGAKLYHCVPDGRTGRKAEVAYVDIHGGGFTSGGGELCELRARSRSADWGLELYSIDYRMLPEHQYPAPLDDCMAAWRLVLKAHKPGDLVIGGSSAGGNLAAAVLMRARDEGLPMPAGALLLTPVMDLTGEGDSRQTNKFLDVNLYGSLDRKYGEGPNQGHPYVSPIYGDFSKGWPPTFLNTGTRDLLLSDTVRTHRALRRAGVWADLFVTEAGGHGGFQGRAPEDMEVLAESLRFMFGVWGIKG